MKKLKKVFSALSSYFGPTFECPICSYKGRFRHAYPPTGRRTYAQCPKCGAFERHRLQYLALELLFEDLSTESMSILHFAPEPFFRDYFSRRFNQYETADLRMDNVDYNADITSLPFPDNHYDFIFASHVLEHVRDDIDALMEIRRVLKPSGVAVLPVPLVCLTTIEYPEPCVAETLHVRAPGYDYFERYSATFSHINIVTSDDFPQIHQLYIYEDRTKFPNSHCPWRPPMEGKRHADAVPICYA